MAKRIDVPNVYTLSESLKNDIIKPIYVLFGEDYYAVQSAAKAIENKISPLIESDFDRDIFSGDKDLSLSQVLDSASSFPFGGGKKIVIVKNFEKVSDKKPLANYVKDPPEFTVLLITAIGSLKNLNREPFPSLLKNGYLFEAKELKGRQLNNWLLQRSKQLGLSLSSENAYALIDIVGEDRNLLEMQLQKIFDFLGEEKGVTIEAIEEMASTTKEFSIFNLLDAIGSGKKAEAIKIGYDLLGSGLGIIPITSMLTKYVTVISQFMELRRDRSLNPFQAAAKAGTSGYFYKNCAQANFMHNSQRLLRSVRALYQADLKTKTTASDEKTVLAVMIEEMMR